MKTKEDRVQHPSYYTWLKDYCGVEVIDIARHMNFNLGNALKYILRSGRKTEIGLTDKEKQIEDLNKAAFYIEDEIKRLEKFETCKSKEGIKYCLDCAFCKRNNDDEDPYCIKFAPDIFIVYDTARACSSFRDKNEI